tara:strand:+ start:2480 stop:2878 length:399 start_codon:yes stop_codon:yes gene_type:complete
MTVNDSAGIIVRLNNLALLGRRSKLCETLHGYWSMPCGMCEDFEDPMRTATREFFEETNITLKSEIHFLTKFQNLKGGTFHVFYTDIKELLYPDSRAMDAIEHDEWGFFKIEKNCLPNPITKDTKNAILMLK